MTFDPLGFLKDWWQREAQHYSYLKLPMSPAAPAKAGENYFQLTLSEMFIINDRRWFAEWQPAAYVAVRFRFGDKDELFNYVAGTSGLKDLDAGKIGQGVALNFPITPLVPFNGGMIEIDAGLVAVKGEDGVKRLLKVLGDFSRVLAVPQLSTALSFAGPLAEGTAELLGAAGNRGVLRLHDTFAASGNPLQATYLVVHSATAGTLDDARMTVEAGRLRYDGKPLDGYNYMVFRIDTPTERDDYDSLSSIEEPFLEAIDALKEASQQPDPEQAKLELAKADRRLAAAKFAAFKAKELTKIVGRNQVVKALADRFAEAKTLFGGASLAEAPIVTLTGALAGRISAEDARRLGELTEAELLDL